MTSTNALRVAEARQLLDLIGSVETFREAIIFAAVEAGVENQSEIARRTGLARTTIARILAKPEPVIGVPTGLRMVAEICAR